jgi:diguanylate cyclase (GGDEF)-like protein
MSEPTILVVDDELFFRRLYAELLGEDGYRVETVASGDEAIDRLQRGGVDLVLTDMVMPGLDGLELLRLARGIENPPEVILATGHATLETAIQALKNGARDYLIKPFNPDELRHLVRTCLEQRRLLDENSLLKSQIRLFQKGQHLASILEIGRLIPQALDTMLHELGSGRGFGCLLGKNGVSRLLGLHGITEAEARTLTRSFPDPMNNLTGMVTLRSDQLAGDLANLPPGLQTFLLFPLRYQNQVRGALICCNPEGWDYGRIPYENLQFLADQTALGFENALRYHGARELMYTDDLTGLYNHRYMHLALEQEIRRAGRYGLEFCLIFIDLDFFKNINDRHGHLAGSKALREVAGVLRKSVREVDSLFRYGGDEFTALLIETDFRGASIVAERMRRTLEEHVFLAEEGLNARLTATLGFACFPEHGSNKKALIDLADKAMYEGKKQRNVIQGAGGKPGR